MTHWRESDQPTIEEAEQELSQATTFRREPAEWASTMIRDRDAATMRPTREAFLSAGFSESDADDGIRRLSSREYLNFEDVATSMLFESSRHRASVTSGRIAQAAAQLKAGQSPKVSEAAFDEMDDVCFGKPRSARVDAMARSATHSLRESKGF